MLTLIIFVIVLSILIFVHELGHFIFAKRAGMKVEEFGFGFPPRILGLKRNGTIYSLNWIPFGGFVKIFGEDGEHARETGSFGSAPARIRAMVLIAGVLMNFLLAVVLLTIGNTVGLRVGLVDEQIKAKARDIKVQIIQIAENSPAEEADLRALDEIIAVRVNSNRTTIKTVPQMQNVINSYRGREITLEIADSVTVRDVNVVPRVNPPPGQGALGILLAETGIVKYPWYLAAIKGIENSFYILKETVIGYATIIKNLFVTGRAGVELTGPVGIAMITGQAARLGFAYLIQLMALISINLAVLNIIPFPALDGGRLLFVLIEKIKGSPVPKKIEAGINAAGFMLLIMLMIFITTKDLLKFF